jgi:hypothetical protein
MLLKLEKMVWFFNGRTIFGYHLVLSIQKPDKMILFSNGWTTACPVTEGLKPDGCHHHLQTKQNLKK